VGTTGVHKREKKEASGQPTAETRARARDGSWSRWGGGGLIIKNNALGFAAPSPGGLAGPRG
jgi:hypothetical protein